MPPFGDASTERLGQTVGGYVLERMLGRGGMSVVYRARHAGTGHPAAVKILQRDLPDDIDAARRMEQEARAIARIDHPNVVRVHDFGWTPEGLPFLALEYLEGQPLSQVFVPGRPTPVPRLLGIVRQMLAGLQRAHEIDIIHRDLKPENVLLVRHGLDDDFVKMLDFGIAKLIGTHPHSLVNTRRGIVLGTPEYLPPEIAMDLTVSPATDLYAIGVILFEGLTGRLPFTASGPAEMAEKHCFLPPPRPRTFNPEVPLELEHVVLSCLAKDAQLRPQSAAALAEALAPFVERRPFTTLVCPPPAAALDVGERDAAASDPGSELAPELDRFERELRAAAGDRWAAGEVPAPLARSLAELERLRELLLQRQADLALLDQEHAFAAAVVAALHVEADSAAQSAAEAEARVERMEDEDRLLSTQLTEADGRAAQRLLAVPRAEEPTTRELQAVLSPPHIERSAAGAREREGVAARELERRRVLEELSRAIGELSERTCRHARLWMEAVQAEGQRRAIAVRCTVLRAEVGEVRRAHTEALQRCALDLAIAAGNR